MTSAVNTYAFINAKLRAKIGVIRDPKLQEDLLKAGSLVEAIGILKEHGYDKASDVYDKTGDLQLVELSLLNDEIQDLVNIRKFLSGAPKELIKVLLIRIEAENLKNAIRLWYSSAVHHRPIAYRSAYLVKEKIVNDINYTSIINAFTFDNIIEAVKGSFYENVFKQYSLEDLEANGLFEFETAIDLKVMDLLYQASNNLKNDDKVVALKLFKMEVDLKNIIILVRYGWFHQLESDRLIKLLYPYSRVYKSDATKIYINTSPKNRTIENLLKENYSDLSSIISDNTSDSKNRMINQIRALEKYLFKKKGQLFESCLGGKPFTVATALAYFYLREQQYSIICAILGGKYYGVDSQVIKGLII